MSLSDEYDALVDEGADGLTPFQAYEALCNIGKNPTGLDFYNYRQNHDKGEDDPFTLAELEELNAVLDSAEESQEDKLRNAFAQFDDGNGYVSKEELKEMLAATDVYESGLHSDTEMFDSYWTTTLNAGDTNEDGLLSIDELVTLLTSGGVTM